MRKDKYNRMLAHYAGFAGQATIKAIRAQIPQELFIELTGRQLGLVMRAVNQAYHNGRASTGAEMVDNDAVWINGKNKLVEV